MREAVSTHSRPKAAGCSVRSTPDSYLVSTHSRPKAAGLTRDELQTAFAVSTHSRPKAAGVRTQNTTALPLVSTHSRPKAAGQKIAGLNRTSKFQLTAARRRLALIDLFKSFIISFNSQPPEGGWIFGFRAIKRLIVSTHSRPKAAGMVPCSGKLAEAVSTHSRPKAAGWADSGMYNNS